MTHSRSILLLWAAAAMMAACDRPVFSAVPADRTASIGAAPAVRALPPRYVVDSALPMEEQLRRFQRDVSRPKELSGGGRSRQALVDSIVRALGRADTAALVRLQVTRGEFAFLLYPSSPLLGPPYRQPPDVAWMLLRASGDKGLRRLLDRRGGRPLFAAGIVCPDTAVAEGENRYWRRCELLVVRAPGDTARERLFGAIVERRGQFKLLSFENQY